MKLVFQQEKGRKSMINRIELGKRYFLEMRPIRSLPFIGWGYTTSSDREKWVECEVVENRIKDSFKVALQSVEKGYGREEFYPSDFDSLVERGIIIEKTSDSQHVEEITWKEPLTSTVYIEHSAYVVV